MSGYYSLTQWNGISQNPVFIGLANFKTIFS
jgi:ABC-type sugar transport system permease subunit